MRAVFGAFLLSSLASLYTVTNAAISSATITTCIPKSAIGAAGLFAYGNSGSMNISWPSRRMLTADILENLSLVVASASYPSRIDWLIQIASWLTKIKFGLMPIGVVLLSVMVVLWFIRGRPKSKVSTGR